MTVYIPAHTTQTGTSSRDRTAIRRAYNKCDCNQVDNYTVVNNRPRVCSLTCNTIGKQGIVCVGAGRTRKASFTAESVRRQLHILQRVKHCSQQATASKQFSYAHCVIKADRCITPAGGMGVWGGGCMYVRACVYVCVCVARGSVRVCLGMRV